MGAGKIGYLGLVFQSVFQKIAINFNSSFVINGMRCKLDCPRFHQQSKDEPLIMLDIFRGFSFLG